MTYDEAVAQARAFITQNRSKGTRCPVCLRPAKIYSRHIKSSAAIVLIALRNKYYRDRVWSPVHGVSFIGGLNLPGPLKTVIAKGDWQKLRFWGLIIPIDNIPSSGGKTSGHWGITQLGIDFVDGKVSVPYTVYEFHSEVLGHDGAHRTTTIDKALGKRFNFQELMRDL